MQDITVSVHAAQRYQERFAGNLGWRETRQRLRRLLRRARFLQAQPGGARIYRLGTMRFVVENAVLITVYRPHYREMPPREDLWCLAG